MIPDFWLPYVAIQLCYRQQNTKSKIISEINFNLYFKWFVAYYFNKYTSNWEYFNSPSPTYL